MYVEVNTSNGIANNEGLQAWATEFLNERLARYQQDIHAIEVQMTDENQEAKGGSVDKRVMLEARIDGQPSVAVTHHAADQDMAFRGAADKLLNALERKFGKMDRKDRRARETIRRDPEVLAGVPPTE